MRLPIIAFLLVLLASCQSSNSTTEQPKSNSIVIQNVTVIPMTGTNTTLTNQTVVIKSGKISKIGAADNVEFDKNATIIDGSGKYLLPGLAEMHAHIPVPQNGSDSLVKQTLFLYLSRGVTTIRGMLGDPYHLELKKQAANGEILSPRIYTSSPSFNGNTAPTPEEARKKVMQYKKDGYDFLKIHPGVSLASFNELARMADEVGIRFAGHVPVEVGVHRAIEAGYASIDHLDGFIDGLVPSKSTDGGFFGYNYTDVADLGLLPALAQKAKEAEVWVVPTQTLMTRWFSPKSGAEMGTEPEMQYMPPSTRYNWRQSKQSLQNNPNYSKEKHERFIDLRQKLMIGLRDAGVGILLGSDAPQVYNVPGFSALHEMEAMADAGFTPYEILQAGTVNPAIYFNATEEYGTVTEGASANLILLDANPLENISNIRQQAGVMVRGEWLSKAVIDKRLQEIAAQYVGAN